MKQLTEGLKFQWKNTLITCDYYFNKNSVKKVFII